MSVLISTLPVYTGTAADLRWYVMNNSGETQTFRFSGYSTSITYGSGTDSIKSVNSTGAAGTNSIAIGKDTNAAGNGSVNIGNSYGTAIGTDSIAIGRHPGLGNSDGTISIGSGAYNNTPNGIAIGHSTSAQQSGICIGSNTTRATGLHSVSLGNTIENNLGAYSIMVGYNNSCYAPFNGNPYGVVIGSGHRVDNTGYYNTILGGANTTISGASNTFIGNGVGLTSVREGDIIINSSGNTISGTDVYKISIGGFSNTISGTDREGTLINGNNNTLTNSLQSAIIGGRFNTISDSAASYIFSRNSTITSGAQAAIIGGHAHTINGGGEVGIFAGYGNSMNGGQDSAIVGGRSNSITMGYACCGGNGIFGGESNSINNTPGLKNGIMGGYGNNIQSSSTNSQIIGGESNTISGRTNVAMLACSGRTATTNTATFVENLVVFNYPALNFVDDTAAAAGGVVLGQIYHNNGAMRIRII